MTPAKKNLAVLIDTHNADHATLLLSQMTYTRVPVVTDEKQFVGTIGLRDIMAYQMEHDLSQEIMADTDIVHMTKTDVAVVSPDFTITEVLHKLVDESFLPVVDAEGIFKGLLRASPSSRPLMPSCMTLVRNMRFDANETGFQPFRGKTGLVCQFQAVL